MTRDAAQATVQRHFQQLDLPGIAYCATLQGTEVVAGGLGHGDAPAQRPIDADTLFGVASVTKIVTAILTMVAAREQRLSLEDRVSAHLPDLKVAKDAPMLIRHLLSHSAGFPGLPFRFRARDLASDAQGHGAVAGGELLDGGDLVAAMNAYAFDGLMPVGETFNYCNEAFCLLGGMIEIMNGMTYPQIADEQVFAPLGMNRSVIGSARLSPFSNIAVPLVRRDGAFGATEFWDAPLFYPAGGMVTTVRDMTRLIDIFPKRSVLGVEAMASRACSIDHYVPARPGKQCGYGFGLEVTHLPGGRTMVWHSGQRTGISSFVGKIIEEDLCVAVCINLADAPAAGIGFRMAGDLLGDARIRWPRRATRVCVTADLLASAVGVYGTDEGFHVRVFAVQDRLTMNFRSRDHDFVFHGDDWGVVDGQTFRFLRTAENTVTALTLDLRRLPRL